MENAPSLDFLQYSGFQVKLKVDVQAADGGLSVGRRKRGIKNMVAEMQSMHAALEQVAAREVSRLSPLCMEFLGEAHVCGASDGV